MDRKILKPLAIILIAIIVVVVAVAAYILRPTVAPSGEIAAVPIEISTELAAGIDLPTSTTEVLSTTESTEEIDNLDLGQIIFEIQQSLSQATFTIDEIFRGVDTTVVGVTNQVAAQILLDFNDPAASQIGLVQINARTLLTNSENRNRAIRNQILDVDDYEFISFEPSKLEGLPESIEIGGVYEIEIIGDLTIRNIVNEVTFVASINIESLTQISGEASTVIQRGDFELTIPRVPSVAGVSENVIIAINFVAVAQ